MNFKFKNIFFFPREKTFDYLIPRWQLINPLFIRKARKCKKPIIPWAVNNKNRAKRFLKNEMIIGILTDKPDLMKI